MQRFIGTVKAALVGMPVCVGLLLIAIYPHRPSSILGWVILTVVSIPIVLGLEFCGAGLLQNRFVARMGKWPRIAVGIVAVLFVSTSIMLIWKWIAPHLAMW